MTQASPSTRMRDSRSPRLPLKGIRVLDFCWVMAGPLATSMLADLGAEVIKVESRSRLDGQRLGRPIVGNDIAGGDRGEWPELHPLFHGLNRNKLGITLDVSKPEGLAIARRLVAMSDLVSENYSAGTMRRMGLGYEVLREIKPSIVALSLSGGGQEGPFKDALIYNPLAVGLSGLGSLLGYENEAPQGIMKSFYGDTNAGLWAAIAAIAALFRAKRTGLGTYIDASQWEAATTGLDMHFLQQQLTSRPAAARGGSHPWQAPHGNYPCRGDNAWIAISCENDAQWTALCDVLSLDQLAGDQRFASAQGRLASRAEIDGVLAGATRGWDKVELAERLQAVGVPAAPVFDIRDQFESAHFRARGVHIEGHHPRVGFELLQALPWQTSRAGRGEFRRSAPLIGEHNDYVFRELLGMSDAEVRELTEQEVIH